LELTTLQNLIKLADEYDFIIAADECYAELYADEMNPPTGLLQACATLGRWDFKRCVVFHSLSKRSNAPGLRSGFVAGDAEVLRQFLLYRTYHGCSMSLAVQAASIAAWQDETHVQYNRELYRQKFTAVLEILQPVLSIYRPPAGFYLWPKVHLDDEQFTRELFVQHHLTVLPGSFLSRTVQGFNPGQHRVRIALVPSLEDCIEAAYRIHAFVTAERC
jgi:N-succinyldiaminopimelate aminotransferase